MGRNEGDGKSVATHLARPAAKECIDDGDERRATGSRRELIGPHYLETEHGSENADRGDQGRE